MQHLRYKEHIKHILTRFSILFLCIFFLFSCAVKKDAKKPTTLNAIITSDLHFTLDQNAYDGLVPLVSRGEDVLQTIVNQVIDFHPDVFILTGDNTDSGKEEDVIALTKSLQQIKDAGIEVIVATGNHDFNHMDEETYAKYYDSVLSNQRKDSHSQSYIQIINDIAFLVMDDNTATSGVNGSYRKETIAWLKKQLQQLSQENYFIVYLAHHPLLPLDLSNINDNPTTKEFVSLFEKYDIQLCFTGHQHSQTLRKYHNIYELISGIPLSAPHTLGSLSIVDHTVTYQTIPIDFHKYASTSFAQYVKQKDRTNAEKWQEQIQTWPQLQTYNTDEQEKIIALFSYFLSCARDGSLQEHVEEIQNNDYYTELMNVVADTNYGPWMQQLLKNPPLNSSCFTFDYE